MNIETKEIPRNQATLLIERARQGLLSPSEDETTIVSFSLWKMDMYWIVFCLFMSLCAFAVLFMLSFNAVPNSFLPQVALGGFGVTFLGLALPVITGKQTIEMSYRNGIVVTTRSIFGRKVQKLSSSLARTYLEGINFYWCLTITDIKKREIRLSRHFGSPKKLQQLQNIIREKYACK